MRIVAANRLSQKMARNHMRLFFPSTKKAGILQEKLLLTPHTVSSSLYVCIGYPCISYTFIIDYVNEVVAESVNQYIKQDQLKPPQPNHQFPNLYVASLKDPVKKMLYRDTRVDLLKISW